LSETPEHRPRLWIKRIGKLLLVLVPFLLLWWTFRQVAFEQVWATLRQLNAIQITIWLLINVGLVTLMTGRWWLILHSLGHYLPYLTLTRYRLGSFAVSYFTPGPQFGGEPIQVLALRQYHGIPGTTSTASVGLDKLFELIANFSFLVFGTTIALTGAWLSDEWRISGLALAMGLLVIPLAYLVLMLNGKQPLNRMTDYLPRKIARNRISLVLRNVEIEMSVFCINFPKTVLKATLVSFSVWLCMIFEYWLMTYFLGLQLSLMQAVSALTAARLAFLTPLPGGLGALEASQVLALQTLGAEPTYGISISLLIRLRDILFGLAGLLGLVSLIQQGFHKK
jgi:uncharacterized protein (TIRG00374 family)